ncbi:hypothetical protein Vretimale_1677 [Volvox reticuliferus]|nr:hypothetical protein Vretifemale_15527 [Volvox reticuliferus]GIL95708.1 hypothetical protein Vretimale_1677 [Volvox reticuliferus]
MEVRRALQGGDVEAAMERVNDLDPEILESQPKLFFHLQQQRLIEFIRAGSVESALDFAQQNLAPLAEENAEFLEELERTVALLAFEDSKSSPVGDLMDVAQRQKTASELNAAILQSQAQEREPRLPLLLKLLLWAQAQLDERAIYPRINDLATAQLVPPTKAEAGPVGREEQRGPFAAPPRQGRFDDEGEVIELSIPAPKLDIPHDMKQKNAERSIADTTRAYLRDIRMYLQLVHGGDRDPVKCLLVGNTLGGVAKTWYDQWTLARQTYTFEELATALLARFAPEVQPLSVEARNTLASGSYRMRHDETVPAYQSRFEALITPIGNLTEDERIFWFQRGLSEVLAKKCATDLAGKDFESYGDLVRFTQGVEKRLLAGQRVHAMRAQGPTLDAVANDQGTEMERRTPTAAVTTVRTDRGHGVRGASGSGHPRGSAGAGQSSDPARGKRKGGTPTAAVMHEAKNETKRQRTNDGWLKKWECTQSEFKRRRRMKVCQRCAEEHPTRDCPLLPRLAQQPK